MEYFKWFESKQIVRSVLCIPHLVLCCLETKVFYRQITSQEKDGAVSGVGQW